MRAGKKPLVVPTPVRGGVYGIVSALSVSPLILATSFRRDIWEQIEQAITEGAWWRPLDLIPWSYGAMTLPHSFIVGFILGTFVWLIARSERRGKHPRPRLPFMAFSMLLWGAAAFLLLLIPPIPAPLKAAVVLLALFAGYRMGVCSWRRDILGMKPARAAL